MIPSHQELAEIGVEDLRAQAEWILGWNELVRSGAADGKGSQAQFVASVLGRRPNG